MRIGFYLVEASWVPAHDVQHLMLQNAVDMSAAIATFCVLGYTIAFGKDVHHVIGWDPAVVLETQEVATALRGLGAVLMVSAIFTAGAAGRLPLAGAALGAMLLAGVLTPMLLHWVWAPQGWLATHTFHFVDQGGSCVVHAVGAVAAFAILLVLGRRVMKLKELDPRSVVAGDPAAAAAGLVLIAIGAAALCCHARPLRYVRQPSKPGASYSRSTSHNRSRDVLMLHAGQGGVAGVVSMAAAPHDYSPPLAVAAGASAGALLGFVCRPWDRTAIEDTRRSLHSVLDAVVLSDHCWSAASPCAVQTCSLPAHLVGGVLGPVLVPLLVPDAAVRRQLNGALPVLRGMGAQIGGVLVLTAAAFFGALVICVLIKVLGLLRTSWEEADHRRAKTLLMRLEEISRRSISPFCSRLLPMEEGTELRPGLPPPRDRGETVQEPNTAAQ
ncbi:putative ammonium transporter sll0108 [Schistocerca cancellata]|uniref:putative ammonium transporter sll0108 n=1 Tax=Schistocerca cancellata TaxID=274614 RepID=UPI00211948A2|nr:putative ammonium transporter sll0108 [Schistocerca cancellata]